MIKQISLALVSLGLSASAYAAHPVEDMLPAAPPTVAVTIPQQTGSWAVGVEALYQAPVNGDAIYATTTSIATSATPTVANTDINSRAHNVEVDNDWGWQVDLAYLFAGNGRDVELAWKHLHADDSDSKTRAAGNFMVGPTLFYLPLVPAAAAAGQGFANGWDDARGDSDYDYDHVDLVFGQKMDFGQKVTLRAFGGLRYADIDFRDRGRYFAAETDGVAPPNEGMDTVSLTASSRSDIQGLGPRAGFDAKVRLGGNFSVTGTFAGSLLVADTSKKASASFALFDESADLTTSANLSSKVSDSTRVIPELDARIGLNYAWAFNPDAALEIELGYETINYFDAKDTSIAGFVDVIGHDNDFGIHGPYLRFQLNLA